VELFAIGRPPREGDKAGLLTEAPSPPAVGARIAVVLTGQQKGRLSGPANGSAPLPFTPHVAPRKWQGHGP